MVNVDDLLKAARLTLPIMTKIRREIHQYPELSFQEITTSALIKEHLKRLGIESHTVAKTGVYGVIRCGKAKAELIALRADIDALPITEATGLPFASSVTGVMHGKLLASNYLTFDLKVSISFTIEVDVAKFAFVCSNPFSYELAVVVLQCK